MYIYIYMYKVICMYIDIDMYKCMYSYLDLTLLALKKFRLDRLCCLWPMILVFSCQVIALILHELPAAVHHGTIVQASPCSRHRPVTLTGESLGY